jgi:predicted small lipoprotein YifL
MKRLIMGMILAAILASLAGCIIVPDHDRGRDHDRDERHEEHHEDDR